MAERCPVLVWSFEAGAAALAEFVESVRSFCPDVCMHEGPDSPDRSAEVLVLWHRSDAPEADARALEALKTGLARVVAVVAPGASGMLDGRSKDEPSHVIKINPAWEGAAIATLMQGMLACARYGAHAEDIADTQENFIAVASHDLRTPLSTLRLLHDLFRSKLNVGTERFSPRDMSDFEELLDIMERNLEKMDGFVGDILEAWLLFRGRPQIATGPVSLGSVTEDIVAGLFPLAMKKDIVLDLVTDPALGPVKAEARRVGQVAANLVENAIKYTPKGGSVTVRTFPGKDAEGAVLEVTDTGPGVPEEERGSLFQRFGRGSARATAGEASTGLGLFICREIVEQHGGRTWYEPVEAPGRGSRFFALWPYVDASSEGRDYTGSPVTGEVG